jgi:hypothetical protein
MPLANFEGEMIASLQLVWINASDAQRVDMNEDVRPARGVFNETDSTIGKPGFQSSSGHLQILFQGCLRNTRIPAQPQQEGGAVPPAALAIF